jgi:hypothetical protein
MNLERLLGLGLKKILNILGIHFAKFLTVPKVFLGSELNQIVLTPLAAQWLDQAPLRGARAIPTLLRR